MGFPGQGQHKSLVVKVFMSAQPDFEESCPRAPAELNTLCTSRELSPGSGCHLPGG